uniref:Acyl-CoA synthetase family member 2, mitochondrial n=2 Tax=Bursaphelenchus xylophilus TaxID=6326 RepID=A0A1I7SCH7_BURXY
MVIYKSTCPDLPLPEKKVHEYIFEYIRKHEAERPHQPMFIDSLTGIVTTGTQIIERTLSLANFLRENGFEKDDFIVTPVENGWPYVCAMLAVSMLGGGVAGAHPKNSAYEISHQVRLCKAKFVMCQDHVLPKILEILDDCALVKTIITVGDKVEASTKKVPVVRIEDIIKDVLEIAPEDFPQVDVDIKKSVYFLPPSSGTTGLPKGVCHTHYSNMYAHWNFVSVIADRLLNPNFPNWNWRDNKVLLNMQQGFAYGHGTTFVSLVTGSVGVFVRKPGPDHIFHCIDKYQIRLLYGHPALFQALTVCKQQNPEKLSTLVAALTSGAPLKEKVAKEFMSTCNVSVLQMYGMTEGMVAMAAIDSPITSVGRPMTRTELRIVDAETGEELGPQEVGELQFRNPTMSTGYLNNPETTAELYTTDGFLNTGDIGYVDEQQNIFIVDRKKEMIKVQGKSVAPGQLEDLLYTNKKIRECCVFGVPDDTLGESIWVFVVKRDESLTEKEVIDTVNPNILDYKQITGGVEFVDVIPRNTNGKMLRRKLREIVMSNNNIAA